MSLPQRNNLPRAFTPEAEGPRGIAFWLMLVIYPIFNSVGNYPIVVGSGTMSVEFVFSLLCVAVVAAMTALGSLRIVKGNSLVLLGLVIWLVANVLSILGTAPVGAEMHVFRMCLKAFLGYIVFWVLINSGEWKVLLKCYLVGCILAGLCGLAYWAKVGDLEQIRQSSYIGIDPDELDIDLFRGVARAGVGNLMPFWICIVLYLDEPRRGMKAALLACIPFFAVLSMLALRREVLVEGVVGVAVLLFLLRGRARVVAGIAAVFFSGAVVVLVGVSERWRERLLVETRDQFQSVSDPRTVLLLNTPRELINAPIVGHGVGSYRFVMGKYVSGGRGADEIGIAPHNSFSRAAVETGLLGLGGFTLMIGALGWKCYFGMTRAVPQRGVLRLACAMIFLHVMDWLFFGDGIASNTTWYFIGVLLFFDRRLSQNPVANRTPRTGRALPPGRNWRAHSHA